MEYLSRQALEAVRMERKALEVDVAKAVASHLISMYKTEIKGMILTMINKMWIQPKFADWVKGKKSFTMWQLCGAQPTEQGMQRVWTRVSQYKPSGTMKGAEGVEGFKWLVVCADVIRLFGEFSEEIKDAGGRDWDVMLNKGQLRDKLAFSKYAEKDKDGNPIVPHGHRARVELEEGDRTTQGAPFVDFPRKGDLQYGVDFRGVEKFDFLEHSVISDVYYTYGLHIEGADVSGTTADSIAALWWASKSSGRVNMFPHLIAIATMVPQGHHTLTECAYPLTKNGIIDYSIGFYESLIPKRSDGGMLRAVLKKFELDKRNKHVLVVRGAFGQYPAGVFRGSDEIGIYRELANVQFAYKMCIGGAPSRSGLLNFFELARRPEWKSFQEQFG